MNANIPAQRDARFDLIRIIAMGMIVMGHFMVHGIRQIGAGGSSPLVTVSPVTLANYAICQWIMDICTCGTDLFMLITGFFLIKPRPLEYALRKTARLWLEIVLFGVGILLIFVVAGADVESRAEFSTLFFPIYNRVYWFLTVYVGVLLLAPFLAYASRLTHRQYLVLLIILFAMNFEALYRKSFGESGGMSLFFFIFVFMTGGYFGRFGIPERLSRWSGWAIFAIIAVFAYLILRNLPVSGSMRFHIMIRPNNGVTYILSGLIFIWLAGRRVKWLSETIIWAAPGVMAVYLIHEHPCVRAFLWNHLVAPRRFLESPLLNLWASWST